MVRSLHPTQVTFLNPRSIDREHARRPVDELDSVLGKAGPVEGLRPRTRDLPVPTKFENVDTPRGGRERSDHEPAGTRVGSRSRRADVVGFAGQGDGIAARQTPRIEPVAVAPNQDRVPVSVGCPDNLPFRDSGFGPPCWLSSLCRP